MQMGRKILYTDVPEITYENVIEVVRKALPGHEANATRIDYLLRYDAGEQPLPRVKQTKTWIDVQCVDNVANEISKFHIGYKWGVPITIVQRGEKDNGTEDETKAISLLNECYEAQSIRKKTQELARFVEICGIGYTYVDVNMEYEEDSGDSYFTVDVLDPETAFVIHSSYYRDKRPMLGVTYRKDEKGNRYFSCFSKDGRFEIKNLMEIENGEITGKTTWGHDLRSGEENPLHRVPIIEWIRDFDRMGCFERQIDDMDCLNLIESDICNASEEAVNSIWHCNDVEFPTEVIKMGDGTEKEVPQKPKNNEWLQTFTTKDGKTPFVTPLATNFDYEGNLNYAITKRALILQKADVPSRGSASGGNTGLALDTASGANNTEAVASSQQNITEGCKMEEIKVVLAAIRESPFVPADSPLLKLRYRDVQPNIKRNKSYEMSTKANCFSTLVSHGINGYHALKVVNMFDDVNQVYADSAELIEKYQNSIFDKTTGNEAVGGDGEQKPNADRTMQDESDQETNSPNLSGKETIQGLGRK